MAEGTEAAQKLADEHGLDLNEVTGTGANDRVTADDVRAHVEALAEAESAGPPVDAYLKRGFLFRTYELEDGRVLHRDQPLTVHPDDWKDTVSKLSVGGVKIAEKR